MDYNLNRSWFKDTKRREINRMLQVAEHNKPLGIELFEFELTLTHQLTRTRRVALHVVRRLQLEAFHLAIVVGHRHGVRLASRVHLGHAAVHVRVRAHRRRARHRRAHALRVHVRFHVRLQLALHEHAAKFLYVRCLVRL